MTNEIDLCRLYRETIEQMGAEAKTLNEEREKIMTRIVEIDKRADKLQAAIKALRSFAIKYFPEDGAKDGN